MATKLDELIVELKASDKGLEVALATAQSRISRLETENRRAMSGIESAFLRARNAILTLGTAYAAFRVGKGIVEAGMQMEAMRNRMRAATGDAAIAAESLAYVREESKRLGIDVRAAADGFSGFAASALRTGLTFQEAKDIFSGVSEAVVAMRLDTHRTQLVFTALSQMASKNAVTMEDLKQQLGEHLPGALQIFASAMGKSNAEFIKMIENGRVTGADLVRLGQGLRKDFGQAAVEASNSAQSAFNRMGNAFFELQAKMAESGFLDAITKAVNRLTEAMNDPATQAGLRGFATLLGDIVTAATNAASAIGRFYSAASQRKQDLASWDGTGNVFDHLDDAAKTRDLRNRVLADFEAKQKAIIASKGETSPAPTSDGYTLGRKPAAGETTSAAKIDEMERAARQADQLRERLAQQVDSMRYQFAGPEQQAAIDVQRQQETLREALEAKAITEQEFRDLNIEAELAYQDELKRIRQEALEEDQSAFESFLGIRIKSMEEMCEATVQDQAKGFRDTIAQAAQHNRVFFQIEKAAALARALIAARESVVNAYNFGSRFGPFVGAAFAGIAAAAQAANIASIASTSFGSSNGVAAAGGATASGTTGNAIVDDAATSSASTVRKDVTINLYGKGYSKTDMREILEGLNDVIADGSQLRIVGVNYA